MYLVHQKNVAEAINIKKNVIKKIGIYIKWEFLLNFEHSELFRIFYMKQIDLIWE